jgi:catechol 2,3-dioxygenase-like lactoylglutathione lyase family enzyme
MELFQGRIVTDDVQGLADFYARLMEVAVPLNEFYVEVPTGSLSVGFSKCRFTEEHSPPTSCSLNLSARAGEIILDFEVDDVDAEYTRIDALGVEWVLPPTTQPWGRRAMLFRDPEGHLINVCSRQEVADG